ncbi:MAG: outer membrane protein assembly factor BamD [Gammaproteobacteria bacterium]|nr:outer membrane protein assembly factor BamD [Gammaproteobacteria bacterium]
MSLLRFRQLALLLILTALIAGCSSKKARSVDALGRQQVQELYNKGKRALDSGNYSFAIDYYRALEANYPYGDYTEQAKLDMLFAYDKLGRIEEAVEAADDFIKLYPTHKNVDYAYYMKGVASFEKKKNRLDKMIKGDDSVRDPQPYRDSMEAFEDLLQRYPNSIYADDARQRIVYIRNALAARELAIAKFYFDSETYVAALNRCKTIIYEYETSPAVEGALVLMERTYLEMGLDDLAASTHEILVKNFPDYGAEPLKAKKKGIFSRLNPFR